MTVELKECNGVHLVGFLKNGVKSGTPLQLEYVFRNAMCKIEILKINKLAIIASFNSQPA